MNPEESEIEDVVVGKVEVLDEVDPLKRQQMERAAKIMKLTMMTKLLKSDAEPAEVIPGVFLGSIGAAQNEQRLLELGITHVLCVGKDIAPKTTLVRKIVSIHDSGKEELRPHIDGCLGFMNEAITAGGGVLVHCFAGKSRSSSMVIAYLMLERGMEYFAAFDLVRSKRRQANPNPGFCMQLKDLGLSFRPAGARDAVTAGSATAQVSNTLLAMIRGCGGSTSVVVAERPEEFIVVHQKFGISPLHLTVVPVRVIPTLDALNREHLSLLREGVDCALGVLAERWEGFERALVRVGFVHPQAVEQVQVHLVAPPFHHERLFTAPRWHSLEHVVEGLETMGRVEIMGA